MLDDFWGKASGTVLWRLCGKSCRIACRRHRNPDPIFHIVYDLDKRYQIMGQWALERENGRAMAGFVPGWRGIYDAKGRLMVAITYNNDRGRFMGVCRRSDLSGKIFGAGGSGWVSRRKFIR